MPSHPVHQGAGVAIGKAMPRVQMRPLPPLSPCVCRFEIGRTSKAGAALLAWLFGLPVVTMLLWLGVGQVGDTVPAGRAAQVSGAVFVRADTAADCLLTAPSNDQRRVAVPADNATVAVRGI